MQDLLRTTAERAARYLAGLKNPGVAPTPEALANLRRLDEALPEHPTDPATVIALLDEIGSPATMASAGGSRRPWQQTTWRPRGIKTRGSSSSRLLRHAWKKSPCAGCWMSLHCHR